MKTTTVWFAQGSVSLNPFDVVKNVNEKGEVLIQTDQDERDYKPFVVNKALSFIQGCLPYVEVINRFQCLDPKMQYLFYYHGIPKGKRFGKWMKNEKSLADVQMLSEFYCINTRNAEVYLSILSEEQVEVIREKMNKGGRNAKT